MTCSRAEVERELIAVLLRHVPDGIEIRTTSTITGDLCLDSLAVMEVIADVEDRFRLKIPDQDLPDMHTVSDVLDALYAHLATKGTLS